MKALIICAAPGNDCSILNKLANTADIIICADGGLKYAMSCSIHPDFVIGDFDSFTETVPDLNTIRYDSHKDDTDTICCINKALELGCDNIILTCALGGRTDHTLANIASLSYAAEKGAFTQIISSCERISLLTEGEYVFENEIGKTFSLLPFGNDCTVSCENAEYPLDRLRLRASYPLGISNIFTRDPAVITIHSGAAVLIINEVL